MRTGLLLVDLQNDYFPGGKMELAGILQASEKARSLLDHFRKSKLPVFHVQHVSLRPGATFFLPGTEGVKIRATLEPLAGETVLEKHHPNSFRETPLLEVLRKQGLSDLVIAGAMSHMCVDATVRAGCDLGYSCTVIEDACATKDLGFRGITVPAAQVHAAFMAALQAAYAKVMTAGEFLS
ncbi:MAG: cysteine hydrolase [Desulfobacterota bacterium]|nr:cysteine hydrolase [Thermodesulfobacteriota bacterium]